MSNWRFDESKNTLFLQGRMDAQTSPLLEKELRSLVGRGKREIFVDCAGVPYVSSAGLRVFLSFQKQLKPISGGIVLLHPSENLMKVFELSGLDKLFDIVLDDDPAEKSLPKRTRREKRVLNGIGFELATRESAPGKWSALVSRRDLISEFYQDGDAYAVGAGRIVFGFGMSAPGVGFQDCKNLIGESVVVKGNYFYYPAIKNAAVDFVLAQEALPGLSFQFFTGGLFEGEFSHVLSFDGDEYGPSLGDLVQALGELAETNVFGVVGVLESAGIWGMNFKKTPVAEHFPKTGSMKDRDRFAEFMDFPIEAGFKDHVVVAAGLAFKSGERLSEPGRRMFPEESASHVHAVVMEKGPVSRNIEDFQGELERAATELKPLKVQHLLQKSVFKGGLLGVVPVDEE